MAKARMPLPGTAIPAARVACNRKRDAARRRSGHVATRTSKCQSIVDAIILCVRWYLRFKLTYRDLAAIAAELGSP